MERQYIYAKTSRGFLAGLAVTVGTTGTATLVGSLVAVLTGSLGAGWLVGGAVFVGGHLALVPWIRGVDRRAVESNPKSPRS